MVRQPRRTRTTRAVGLATAAVSLFALTTGFTGSASAETSGAKTHAKSTACVVLTDLTETNVNRNYYDVAPEGLSVGDAGRYTNEVHDVDGKLRATVYGTTHMIYSDADQHVIATYDEKIVFTDGGRIHTLGTADINNMLAGGSSVIGAVGTGGRYKGYHGVRQWDFKTRDVVVDTFRLCPDQD
jgi:hypothetical protein